MEIIVTIKSVYGRDLIYPVCSQARIFASIADTETLTPYAIDAISRSGRMVLVGEPKQYDTEPVRWFELLCVCPLAISLNPSVKTLLTSL